MSLNLIQFQVFRSQIELKDRLREPRHAKQLTVGASILTNNMIPDYLYSSSSSSTTSTTTTTTTTTTTPATTTTIITTTTTIIITTTTIIITTTTTAVTVSYTSEIPRNDIGNCSGLYTFNDYAHEVPGSLRGATPSAFGGPGKQVAYYSVASRALGEARKRREPMRNRRSKTVGAWMECVQVFKGPAFGQPLIRDVVSEIPPNSGNV